MAKVLVPIDGSAGSDKAVRFALNLGEKTNSEIILINVQPSYDTPNVKRFFSREQIRTMQEESSKQILDHTLEITKGSTLPVSTIVRTGIPGEEICAVARESAVDLIVMGYRGLGAIKRVLLGSVATNVLHETPCPVTIVP